MIIPPMNTITTMMARYGTPSAGIPEVKIPAVDFSKDYVVIWVPGTNDHKIPSEFSDYIKRNYGPKASIVMADYQATWDFMTSLPHGYRSLQALLDHVIASKRPGTKIVVAGLSQGSLILSELLTHPKYRKAIHRAALLGHPGMATNHGSDTGKVWEHNNTLDPSTLEWRGDKPRILYSIHRLRHGDLWAGVYLLKVGLTNPAYAAALVALGVKKLPFRISHSPSVDPHNYTEWYDDAARWLFS